MVSVYRALLNLAEKNETLLALFPSEELEIETVNLHDILVIRDGPSVIVRFDLIKNPTKFPKKWTDKAYKTVQITLRIFSEAEISIDGLSSDLTARLDLQRASANQIKLSLVWSTGSATILGKFLIIDRVTAY
jgi:hypothetical protein